MSVFFVFSPGVDTFPGPLFFFLDKLGLVLGGVEATRPHRRLIRPAALRLHGPTGWVFSLSPWE
ncbi:hypothetical protein, partial [Enterobacter intestinihominis]